MASAQSLRNSDQPAEFPPTSFTGKQYVDSKGCVFVRAGFDGATTWVPRVSRKRKVLCGFKPSLADAGAAEPAPRVVEVPAPAPAPVATPAVPRRTVAVKPAPTPRVVAVKPAAPTPRVVKVVPAPAPRVVAAAPAPTTARVVARPKPGRSVTAKPAPVLVAPVVTAPRVVTTAPVRVVTACPEKSPISQRYLLENGRYAVRCGPQTEAPRGVEMVGGSGYAERPATATVPRVVTGTRTVTTIRVKPAPAIAPPPGYRAAFADDRFNPNRGLQTREGIAQMRLIWTDGVPRRLVDQNSGRDVGALFPGLRFPFINLRQQEQYVAKNGWPGPAEPTAPKVVVATKNVSPAAATMGTSAGPAGHRYVQVGTFGLETNARNTAARLQNLGLPVRVGKYNKGGKTYSIVLAGPFGSGSQLQAGLLAAQQSGFPDAFTRN